MKPLLRHGAVTALMLTANTAWAEVSPQEVWDDWKSYLESFGYAVEASESTSGGTLSLTDLSMRIELPENEGTMAIDFGSLSLAETGDGGVDIQLPATLPVEVSVTPTTGERVEMTLLNSYDDLEMTVTGSPGDMVYTYSAASDGISLDRLAIDGREVPVSAASVKIESLSGSAAMQTGELRVSKQDMRAERVSYDLDMTSPDPEEPGRVQAQGMITDVTASGTTRLPAELDPENMAAMLNAGLAFDGAFAYGGGQSSMNFESEEETVSMSASNSGASISFAMDREHVSFSGNTKGTNNTIQTPDLPFPIEFRIEEAGFNLMMPLAMSDEPRDFALALTLAGFSTSEALWSLIDPQGKLPHDPATIAFDLAGKLKFLIDPFDPEQVRTVEAGESMPAEVYEATLNALTVSALGAELTGEGGFTFNNEDLTTFNGMPAPDGAVDLRLVGANALLDRLVEMGMLPEERVMGMRMMLGLFAVPGDGEDVLTSKIEVREDGQVLANGQRIK